MGELIRFPGPSRPDQIELASCDTDLVTFYRLRLEPDSFKEELSPREEILSDYDPELLMDEIKRDYALSTIEVTEAFISCIKRLKPDEKFSNQTSND